MGALFYWSENRLRSTSKAVFQLIMISLIFAALFTNIILNLGIIAGVIAGAIAVSGVSSSIFLVAVAFAIAFVGTGEFNFVIVVVISFVIVGIVDFFATTTKLRSSTLIILVGLTIGCLCFSVQLAVAFRIRSDATSPAGIVLFIGILPLINALFDFASVGLTRYCLRRGLAGKGITWAMVDLAGAMICFFTLGAVLILFLQHITPQNGEPLLSFSALFETLNDAYYRPPYSWLGFMMFSTLLPTLAHAILALVAVCLGCLKPIQTHLGEWIAGAPTAAHIAWFAISGLGALIISVTLTVPFVIADHYIHVVAGTISLFEAFAAWSGAI